MDEFDMVASEAIFKVNEMVNGVEGYLTKGLTMEEVEMYSLMWKILTNCMVKLEMMKKGYNLLEESREGLSDYLCSLRPKAK